MAMANMSNLWVGENVVQFETFLVRVDYELEGFGSRWNGARARGRRLLLRGVHLGALDAFNYSVISDDQGQLLFSAPNGSGNNSILPIVTLGQITVGSSCETFSSGWVTSLSLLTSLIH